MRATTSGGPPAANGTSMGIAAVSSRLNKFILFLRERTLRECRREPASRQYDSAPEVHLTSGRAAQRRSQLSDSTNTSSRFLRSDGSNASTSRKAAVAINTADSGRVKN